MKPIKISTQIDADLETVWQFWTEPEHITNWNFASDDWHCPSAKNDLRVGGKYSARMEAKDGNFGFDFGGTYNEIQKHKHLAYTLDDGRKVTVDFKKTNGRVQVIETFEPETENPAEMQRSGWKAILNNFKKYAESADHMNWQTLRCSIEINAPKEKVWNTMLGQDTYRQWTRAFAEGSHFEGSWDQGSTIYFLDASKKGGMVSEIVENRPYEYISIKHIGLLKNGKVDTESPEVKKWAPAFENYTFTEKNGVTKVEIDMDVEQNHKAMFQEMWPRALVLLKQLSEK